MTRFALVSGPASEPVTLEELKAHARISHDFEDALLSAYIVSARQAVEAATGRACSVSQTWTLTLDRWPLTMVPEESEVWPFTTSPTQRRIQLEPRPVLGITSLVVDGTTIASTEYALRESEIWIKDSVIDSDAELGGGIVITFTAGYATVPEQLKTAVKMMAAHLTEARETTSPQGIYHQVTPYGFDTLIAPYKVLKV